MNRPVFSIPNAVTPKPRGLGISIFYTNGYDIFFQNYTTKDQVKSNLINFILTNKGERVFDPEFGGNVRAYLFENIDSFDNLRELLREEIQEYVPGIIINDIRVKKFYSQNLVNIQIDYSIPEGNDVLNINVDMTTILNNTDQQITFIQ